MGRAATELHAAAEAATLDVDDASVMLALCGPRNEHLAILASTLGLVASARGQRLFLRGESAVVAVAMRFVHEAAELARAGKPLAAEDIPRALRLLRDDHEASLRHVYDAPVFVGAAGRKPVSVKGANQRAYVEAIGAHDLTFGVGPAGTGKTFLAMACAVRALTERRVRRIVLTRPAVEAGERLGFLPGDLAEKVNPYLRPLYDALNDLLDTERAQQCIAKGQVEVAPLAFMRGRTLSDAFVILDEAQNATSEQMRMFLTRLGPGSKAVVTGDLTQVDLPLGRESGLAVATRLLEGVEGIAVCAFDDGDVVRHPLVQRIVKAYETLDREERERFEARRARADRPSGGQS
jgi:phosphate starvation-inducible protein PhoH and related proteins